MRRAAVSALLGVVLALAGPYLLTDVAVSWQRIVLLSLLLACGALLVASFVLAVVSDLCDRHQVRAAEGLVTLADAFLVSSVGVGFVCAAFSFVLSIVRMA